MLNQDYTIYLKTLTPVHIGASQEKNLEKGIDYISRRGKILRINENQLYEAFDANDIATAFASGNLENLIKNRLDEVTEVVYSDYDGNRPIHSNIRNGFGKLMIPGSSIKGAIRSALYGELHRKNFSYEKKNIKENEIFGKASENNDIFRLFKVGDCLMNYSIIVPGKIYNLTRNKNSEKFIGGWKNSFGRNSTGTFLNKKSFSTTGYEVLDLNQVGNFALKIGKGFYETYKEKLNLPKIGSEAMLEGENPIQNLLVMINQHTQAHLKKDLEFFDKFNEADYSQNIIDTIKGLKKKCKNLDNRSTIIRIGSGSGFHSITGDWQYPNSYIEHYFKRGRPSFKSRRLAFLRSKEGLSFYPMGFVLLSLDKLEEEVVERKTKQIQRGDSKYGVAGQVKKSVAEEAEKTAEEYKPTTIPAQQVKKGAELDAVCIGMDLNQALFKVYVEGFENEVFKVRYPAGMETGQKAILKVSSLQGKRFNKGSQLTIGKIIN